MFTWVLFVVMGAPSPVVGPPGGQAQRLAAIEVDGSGVKGAVYAQALHLGAASQRFDFGQGVCRDYRLSVFVLEQLHAALRSGQSVRIAAEPRGSKDRQRRCIKQITFLASPSP